MAKGSEQTKTALLVKRRFRIKIICAALIVLSA